MTRKCEVTGKGAMVGNNVSHANNHTKRRFLINLQEVSMPSEILGKSIKLKVSVRGLRTIEHNGGLDGYALNTRNSRLSPEIMEVKKQLKAKLAAAK